VLRLPLLRHLLDEEDWRKEEREKGLAVRLYL
jgi:hypothetical protein